MASQRYQIEPADPVERAEIDRIIDVSRQKNKKLPFVSVKPISRVDIASWTANQAALPRIYWSSRGGGFEIGGRGVGFAIEKSGSSDAVREACSHLKSLHQEAIFINAQSFTTLNQQNQADPVWRNFPSELTYIPELAIIRKKNDFNLHGCVTVNPGDSREKVSSKLEALITGLNEAIATIRDDDLPRVDTVEHFPFFESWSGNVLHILSAISKGLVEKVVLARRSDYYFERLPETFEIFQKLREGNGGCYAICFQYDDTNTFISFSPERLYMRQGEKLAVDALSSTIIRGETAAEDDFLEKYLRGSDKECREHQQVIDGIRERLTSICQAGIHVGETDIMKLSRIQHLWTSISATLHQGIDDADIIMKLHPTPAVGGQPRQAALDLIGKLEPFARGYYAAPFGIISRDRTEYSTAIRALTICDNRISVFTGAGIIAGSEPEAEWQETENKNIIYSIIDNTAGM